MNYEVLEFLTEHFSHSIVQLKVGDEVDLAVSNNFSITSVSFQPRGDLRSMTTVGDIAIFMDGGGVPVDLTNIVSITEDLLAMAHMNVL